MKNLKHIPLSALLLLSTATFAQDWNPAPPVTDNWDWIRLTSGEWLKGEIIVLYDDSIEFDSDELDTLNLDWDDIDKVRAGKKMQVRFADNSVLKGQLVIDGDTVSMRGSPASYQKSDILSIVAGEEIEANYWSVKYSLGANFRSGNSDQVDVNSSLKLQRRTVTNRFVFDYLANFSETENQETANNHRASSAWDYFLTHALFLRPIFGEYLKDPFQNINYKYTVGTGVGYQVIDNSRVEWLLVGGPGYQKVKFDTVELEDDDTQTSGAFIATSNFDAEISSDVDFFYDYSFTLSSEETGQYTHHMTTGLEIDIGSLFDLDISVAWDRTEKPQKDEDGIIPEQDDYRLIVGLGFEY